MFLKREPVYKLQISKSIIKILEIFIKINQIVFNIINKKIKNNLLQKTLIRIKI